MADEPSIFQKIAGIVGTYAPGLATLLAATGVGAPIAAAVGAVGILAKSLGMPETAKPEDVLSTIQAMPDSELKLKFIQAEQDFQLKMRDLDIQTLKTELADIQGARTMSSDKMKTTGKSDINLYMLAWVLVGGFLILIGFLLYIPVPKDQNGVLFMLFGALAAGFSQVLSFFFGSNKSSENKTAMIYNSSPLATPKADVDK